MSNQKSVIEASGASGRQCPYEGMGNIYRRKSNSRKGNLDSSLGIATSKRRRSSLGPTSTWPEGQQWIPHLHKEMF